MEAAYRASILALASMGNGINPFSRHNVLNGIGFAKSLNLKATQSIFFIEI